MNKGLWEDYLFFLLKLLETQILPKDYILHILQAYHYKK